jgi:hypothetical protein
MQHVVQPGYAKISLTRFFYNGPKPGYALSPLLITFAPEHASASTKVKWNEERLKWNETHSFVTDLHTDGNLLGENVNITKKECLRILAVTSKEISMDVHAEKNK